MQHSGADVLQALLPSPCFVGAEPDAPDECYTVYDTAPNPQYRTQDDGVMHFIWGYQVRVRASTYNAGWQMASAVADLLTRQIKYTDAAVDGVHYNVVACTVKGFQFIGRDGAKSRRFLFTVNGTIAVVQGAGGTPVGAGFGYFGSYFP